MVDPYGNILPTNEVTTSAKGGVFKPTSFFTRKSTDPGSDGTGRQTPRRSGAEEKTLEPEKRQRQQPNNLPDALGNEQEAARQTDWPRSGESVASSAKGEVFKPTSFFTTKSTDPGSDGTGGRTPRRSGAQEKTPEPEKR
ncbi:hypothetical protein NDU88_003018 [Pleurodeles waltl]|uniref:Uncharacterized protein n=1 Tax=Pleurodeles waltl TaxID=8319 RepID=A0AAV7T414_PLEWA|nr:hypothetical protein NDU88_003018 [Pleurodeles waltl]